MPNGAGNRRVLMTRIDVYGKWFDLSEGGRGTMSEVTTIDANVEDNDSIHGDTPPR